MLAFSKYQGAGNDFIIIDDANRSFPAQDSKKIADLCDRHLGIGADGLILVQPSAKADFRLIFFNADGKEVSLCGNGLRCTAHFASLLKSRASSLHFETRQGVLKAFSHQGHYGSTLGTPRKLFWKHPITLNSTASLGYVIDTGVPHLVIFLDKGLSELNVEEEGRRLRFLKDFAPHGVNVNFVTRTSVSSLEVRTYERGVEKETLACGTGAAAAAFAVHQLWNDPFPMRVIPTSNQTLVVRFDQEIEVLGPVAPTFYGFIP